MNMEKTKMNKNQKGQTLLFVIVAVTIAMAVGVAVSTRTIQSLKRVARTDTSARVIAAAEGGIENILSRTYSQLDEVANKPAGEINCEAIGAITGPEDGTCSYVFTGTGSGQAGETCTCACNYCDSKGCATSGGAKENEPDITCMIGSPCSTPVSCDEKGEGQCKELNGSVGKACVPKLVDKNSSGGDFISSRAVVKVEKIEFAEGEEFSFTLEPGSLREVNLDGYGADSIKICWESDESAIYYYSYNSAGEVKKGGLRPSGASFGSYLSDLFVPSDESYGTMNCGTVGLVSNPYGLRIKVLYNDSEVAVFPTEGELPTQGYKLTSRGEIVTGSGGEEKATVIVRKSYPYAPDIFDYGIYTPETLSGSN